MFEFEESFFLTHDPQERLAVPDADWEYTLIEYHQVGGEVKPVYETGWGTRRVGANQEIEVHETNNLMINLLQAKKIREERQINPRAPLLGRTHDFYERKGALSIFKTFEDDYPELHTKLLEINQALLKPEKGLDLYTERDIAMSYAWEIIAAIAAARYPEFDSKVLTV
jgi:hypothetical protein